MTDRATEPRSDRKRILVVDDDEGQRTVLAAALTRAGYEVFLAATAAAALLVARELRVDAAVVDLFLPDAGGLGLARALRETMAAVPVIFMTGLAIAAVREAVAPSPVLFKPFSRKNLLTAVARAAGRAR